MFYMSQILKILIIINFEKLLFLILAIFKSIKNFIYPYDYRIVYYD